MMHSTSVAPATRGFYVPYQTRCPRIGILFLKRRICSSIVKKSLMVLLYMRIRPDMFPRSSTVGSVHRCHRFAVWSYKYIPSITQGMSSLIMRPWLFFFTGAYGWQIPYTEIAATAIYSQMLDVPGLGNQWPFSPP